MFSKGSSEPHNQAFPWSVKKILPSQNEAVHPYSENFTPDWKVLRKWINVTEVSLMLVLSKEFFSQNQDYNLLAYAISGT